MKEQCCKTDSQKLFLEQLGQNPASYKPRALLRRQITGTEHGDLFSVATLGKRTEGSSDHTPDVLVRSPDPRPRFR